MARKKILFVCTQAEAGGVQILADSMAKELRSSGFDARILFLYKKRPVFDGRENVDFVLSGKPSSVRDYARAIFGLNRFVSNFRPDAVVGWAHFSSPLAALAGRLNGVPKRVATQTNPPHSYPLVGRVLDRLAGSLGFYTANLAASDYIKSCLADYPSSYRRSLKVAYNGVVQQRSKLTSHAARDKFGLPATGLLMVTCGRLSRQKNHSFLLRLLTKLEDAHLAILGDGELREELESQIRLQNVQEKVTLIGERPPEDVADFLRAGDIFVFPSLYEAFGVALVEAMSAGLPVVASDYPAIAEVVGGAGALLPLSDRQPWLDAIERLRSDRTAYLDASDRARERSRAFSLDQMVAAFRDEF